MKISEFTDDQDHSSTLQRTGFWGQTAAGCIPVALSTGRFCLNQRSSWVQEPGTWGTWGGAVDQNESARQAVLRELQEEAGYAGKVVQLLSLWRFESWQQQQLAFAYENFLAVVPEEFEPTLNWESQNWRWVQWGQWPEPLHPGMQALLQQPQAIQLMQRYAKSQQQITESAAAHTMYHVSAKANRASIQRLGLEPRQSLYPWIKRKPAVFLLATLQQAQDWAFYTALDQRKPQDCWQVQVPAHVQLMPDPATDMQEIYSSWMTHSSIDASQLRLVCTQPVPRHSLVEPRCK